MNCWNFWKLGVLRFHLQLASLEIDLNAYTCTVHAEPLDFFRIQTFDSQTAFNNVYFCRFKNGEPAPIHLLFSNLAWSLALDRRAAR